MRPARPISIIEGGPAEGAGSHYAGDVFYEADEFIDKNVDLLYTGSISMASKSASVLVKELFEGCVASQLLFKGKNVDTIVNEAKSKIIKGLKNTINELEENMCHGNFEF